MMSKTCKQRYDKLATDREPYLIRAREHARLTIPSLMPEDNTTASTNLYTPYQGVGARGVNNLAAKLMLSLFPPNTPFFRYSVDDYTLEELGQDPTARAKVEEALNTRERAVQSEIETSGLRPKLNEAFRQLVTAGNVLLTFPKDKGMRAFRMDKYVVKRDPSGNTLEVIIKEEIHRDALPKELLEALPKDDQGKALPSDGNGKDPETFEVYTKYHRENNKFKGYQEINGVVIPGSEGTWSVDKPPMLALRWTTVDGEDWGRSHVEECKGDLITAEGLTRAIVESAAAAAKVVFLVSPNGATREIDLARSENLDIITGQEGDVTVLQINKQADMATAERVLQEVITRLSFSFLLNTAIQRQAERVTAEEIRRMAQELEDALGGNFAVLSQELQLPLVQRVEDRMERAKRLPKLPKGIVEPQITTGLEALGRGHDLTKIQVFIKEVVMPLGEEGFRRLNIDDLIKRGGTALGIDMDGLVKSAEELAQEQQQMAQQQEQAQMMEMVKPAIGPVAKEMAMGAAQGAQTE